MITLIAIILSFVPASPGEILAEPDVVAIGSAVEMTADGETTGPEFVVWKEARP